jgi:predicted AlkP superfamily phosphohydrolase/phosphomutase
MTQRRVVMVGLDGFDICLAERFLGEGALPNFAKLRDSSMRFDLDQGLDKYSGLAWEHVSTGRAPHDGGRWSAVTFDPRTYATFQEPTSSRPFLADVSARTVVFDVPYCDLDQAPLVRGLTNWGAHDPGVSPKSRPESLHAELERQFGGYPATQWIYGFCWPSAKRTREVGIALTRAVEIRSAAARWLLSERLPDWDLALIVVSEPHSATEPLWHGVDSSHPLHGIESSEPANIGLREVYSAVDRLIGDMQSEFPDAILMVFAMHGMGANEADIPAMTLLPELLYRFAFDRAYMRSVAYSDVTPAGVPLLAENDDWHEVLLQAIPNDQPADSRLYQLFQLRYLKRRNSQTSNLTWMPATRYSQFWRRMPAFALPSFYDGRIRINLEGREGQGLVPVDQYESICAKISAMVTGCRNLLTGEDVVREIRWPKKDPMGVGRSEADLYVIWKSSPLGFCTPNLGNIGPVPYRRTGGHTGPRGFLYLAGDSIASGAGGVISSFDVVPTVLDLVGEMQPLDVTGKSVFGQVQASTYTVLT